LAEQRADRHRAPHHKPHGRIDASPEVVGCDRLAQADRVHAVSGRRQAEHAIMPNAAAGSASSRATYSSSTAKSAWLNTFMVAEHPASGRSNGCVRITLSPSTMSPRSVLPCRLGARRGSGPRIDTNKHAEHK